MYDRRYTKHYRENMRKASSFLSEITYQFRIICPGMFFTVKVISDECFVRGVYVVAHHETKTIAIERFVSMEHILYFEGHEILSREVVKDMVYSLHKHEKRE